MLINKKAISIIMSIIMVLSLTPIVNAEDIIVTEVVLVEDDTVVTPNWSNVASSQVIAGFSSGKVAIRIILSGFTGTTYKNGVVKLYKNSGSGYSLCKTWSGLSSSSTSFSFSDATVTASNNCTYKVSISITAVRSSNSEVISITSQEKTYLVS